MNTSAASILNKRLYRYTLTVLALVLFLAFFYTTYLLFDRVPFVYAIPIFIVSFLIFVKCISWFRRTTYLKYKNNALIVKGVFNKTKLTPIKTVDIEPIVESKRLILFRIKFALDGIQYNYFSFTDQTGFDLLKKRQAISRVL